MYPPFSASLSPYKSGMNTITQSPPLAASFRPFASICFARSLRSLVRAVMSDPCPVRVVSFINEVSMTLYTVGSPLHARVVSPVDRLVSSFPARHGAQKQLSSPYSNVVACFRAPSTPSK